MLSTASIALLEVSLGDGNKVSEESQIAYELCIDQYNKEAMF